MGILSFDKPKKLRSTKDHNDKHTSDSGVDGTYVPNMSKTDQEKWKAKKIGGTDPRVEIRKTINGYDPTLRYQKKDKKGKPVPNCGAQILAIVRPDCSVILSSNGRMAFDAVTWSELDLAIVEAVKSMI